MCAVRSPTGKAPPGASRVAGAPARSPDTEERRWGRPLHPRSRSPEGGSQTGPRRVFNKGIFQDPPGPSRLGTDKDTAHCRPRRAGHEHPLCSHAEVVSAGAETETDRHLTFPWARAASWGTVWQPALRNWRQPPKPVPAWRGVGGPGAGWTSRLGQALLGLLVPGPRGGPGRPQTWRAPERPHCLQARAPWLFPHPPGSGPHTCHLTLQDLADVTSLSRDDLPLQGRLPRSAPRTQQRPWRWRPLAPAVPRGGLGPHSGAGPG